MSLTWVLQREPTRSGVTLGTLDLGGGRFCRTLEDAIREQPGVEVAAWKVAGGTAIPAGRYRLAYTLSQRFGRMLPLLRDVPGFTGVRIHSGNTVADTEGCILVGRTRVSPSRIGDSRSVADELGARLQRALRVMDVYLEIRNPVERPTSPLQT